MPLILCIAVSHALTKELASALFECVQCGFTENADVVGAINVLKRGQEILAAQ